MTEKSKMEVSAFTYGESARNGGFQHGTRHRADGSGILIKVAVCCAAAALVLAVKLVSSGVSGEEAVTAEAGDADMPDERLGRLKFVELPGIIEVFSNKTSSYIGLEATKSEYLSEAMMLRLTSADKGTVSVNEPCKLTCAGTDSDYGEFVILSFSGDVAITVYGFDEITAEEGQPLLAGDELGKVFEGNTIRVTAREGGCETDPTRFVLPESQE